VGAAGALSKKKGVGFFSGNGELSPKKNPRAASLSRSGPPAPAVGPPRWVTQPGLGWGLGEMAVGAGMGRGGVAG